MLSPVEKEALKSLSMGGHLSDDSLDVIYDIINDMCDNFIEFACHHPECSILVMDDQEVPSDCDCGFDSATRYILAVAEAVNG